MKVSAVIPAFNAESWIAAAIESVKSQSRPVHELIVIDDGSADRTNEIAKDLGAKVVRLAFNSGEGVARNAGLERASGDVIAWLDADDYWKDNHLEVLSGLLEKFPQASVACAAVQQFGLRNELCTSLSPTNEPGSIFWNAVDDWPHPIIGTMIRRNAIASIGGFSTRKGPSVDYDMWLRLSRKHLFISTLDVTSYWRWHAAQQSRDYGAQLQVVYYFRRRYWENELKRESLTDARKFAETMRSLWYSDFQKALAKGDLSLCRSVFEVRGLIPDIDSVLVDKCRSALPSEFGRQSGALLLNQLRLMTKRLFEPRWII